MEGLFNTLNRLTFNYMDEVPGEVYGVCHASLASSFHLFSIQRFVGRILNDYLIGPSFSVDFGEFEKLYKSELFERDSDNRKVIQHCGIIQFKNKRRFQLDRAAYYHNVWFFCGNSIDRDLFSLMKKSEILPLFVVCDGHGDSSNTSEYCCLHLPQIFAKTVLEKQLTSNNNHNQHTDTIKASLVQSVDSLNARLKRRYINSHSTCGSTIIAGTIIMNKVVLAYRGDSVASVIVDTDDVINLINPHFHNLENLQEYEFYSSKFDNCDEIITTINDCKRIEGLINLTRTMGDFACKSILNITDSVVFELDQEKHKILFLFTDGFWDLYNLDREQVDNFINENFLKDLKKNTNNNCTGGEKYCEHFNGFLVKLANFLGRKKVNDNLTCLLIKLG